MAKGKKRSSERVTEKYVPSFGSSRHQKKKIKLNNDIVGGKTGRDPQTSTQANTTGDPQTPTQVNTTGAPQTPTQVNTTGGPQTPTQVNTTGDPQTSTQEEPILQRRTEDNLVAPTDLNTLSIERAPGDITSNSLTSKGNAYHSTTEVPSKCVQCTPISSGAILYDFTLSGENEMAALPLGQVEPQHTSAMPVSKASEGLQGIIKELTLLNEFIMKKKRELENTRCQNL